MDTIIGNLGNQEIKVQTMGENMKYKYSDITEKFKSCANNNVIKKVIMTLYYSLFSKYFKSFYSMFN